MPEPLLCDLWVDTTCQQVRRVAVPKIMEANPWQVSPSNEADKLVGKAIWLQRLSHGLSDDVHVIRLPQIEPQQFFGLPKLVSAQFLNCKGSQSHRASTTTLCFFLTNARFCLFGTTDDGELRRSQ